MAPITRHRRWQDVPADPRLSPDDGWLKMEVRWLATAEEGAQSAVVGHTVYQPSAPGQRSMHDLHTHPDAEEIIYVLRGSGRARSGDEEFAVGPGSVIIVPRGDLHILENTSQTDTMEVIFVYGGAASLAQAGYRPAHAKKE